MKKKKKKRIRPRKSLSKRSILAYAHGGFQSLRQMSLRTKIYTFACVSAVLMFVIFPMTSSAFVDMFGFGVHDLFANITDNVRETNEMLGKAFEFAGTSPYEIVNGITGTQQTRLIAIRNAITSMALVVATLLLMVEFFRKTVNFEWSSKWENILIFLVKIIVIKQVVQNADVIVGYVYAGFNSINTAALGGSMELLPYGSTQRYVMEPGWFASFTNTVFSFWGNVFSGEGWHSNPLVTPGYTVSMDAVRMFYPNAVAPSSLDLSSTPFPIPTSAETFNPTIEMVLLQPFFLIMKGVAIVVFVIIIGRVFELTLYTIFAPLPLATFASDVSNDVGKSFIKNYIAVVLQIAVIVVMFMVYVGMNRYFANTANGFVQTKFIQIIALITLGLGVIKSGAWARRICGTG